ncbi:hypothetical protein ID866_599 [Astraeus odoratus]|nr:hypothetical protein ID866_599 [Astraeus odoratus]
MGPVPGREALEAMKRTDIQKLCKDYGVKANLKTEALIDLLLDASRPQPPRTNPVQPPERPTSRTSSHSGVRRGSVIIHGVVDDPIEKDTSSRPPERVNLIPPSPQQPPRPRKAKETQYRLGVGRPVLAGGSGARAVTKSVSISRRIRKAKNSTTIQPSEATITEEPEPEEHNGASSSKGLKPVGSSGSADGTQQQDGSQTGTRSLDELVQCAVAEALVPVQKELDCQKAQLAELKDKVSNMIVSFEARIRDLTLEIDNLRAKGTEVTTEVRNVPLNTAQGPPVRIPQPPSTPKRVWSPRRSYEKDVPPEPFSDTSDPGTVAHSGLDIDSQPGDGGTLLPGFSQTTLGKRARDSTPEEEAEIREEDRASELEVRIGRPTSKRAKLQSRDSDPPTQQERSRSPPERGKKTDGPTLERLPDFYSGPSSPPLMSGLTTSAAHPIGGENPFNFSFLPTMATPAQSGYPLAIGMFPLPEPPTSPSPANTAERSHTDNFSFGRPRAGSRSSSSQAASGGSQTHGDASGSAGLQRMPSSNEVASELGLTVIKTSATDPGTPAQPAERTMYGTELEGDTRFGDFGVEGVATGFWTGSVRL